MRVRDKGDVVPHIPNDIHKLASIVINNNQVKI